MSNGNGTGATAVKATKTEERRTAQATIEAIAEELGPGCKGIEYWGRWTITAVKGTKPKEITRDRLDDAFVDAAHYLAGTEPPPF